MIESGQITWHFWLILLHREYLKAGCDMIDIISMNDLSVRYNSDSISQDYTVQTSVLLVYLNCYNANRNRVAEDV